MKKPFIIYIHLIVALLLLSIKNGIAQPYNSGLGLIYVYGGFTKASVNTTAKFEITNPAIPDVNTTLQLEKDLDFAESPSMFYFRILAGGRFQFAGSYMSLKRNGDSYLTRNFSIGDQSYTIGARVMGYLNTQYFSGTVRGSILYKPSVTAGLSLGVRYYKLKAGINASSGGTSFIKDGSFDLPAIVPGVHASFYPLPSLLIRGSLEYFQLKLSHTTAKVVDGQISAEFYILKYLGAGIGYSYLDLRGEGLPDNDLYLKDVNYTIKGMNFFVAFRF
jgi:hypothetical protein